METQPNNGNIAVEDVIRSLNIAIEQKDHYTQGHSIRVAEYSVELAKKIGMPEDEIRLLYRAAMLHDIGQIAIEESVLHKPGVLDEEEKLAMQRHPKIAVQILEPLNFPDELIEIILHHHEWWNGHGYPDGLSRESIPLGARILSIADAFDAMTSDRPHRARMTIPMALNRVEDGANHQWDPDLVAAWLRLERGILEREPAEFIHVQLWDNFK